MKLIKKIFFLILKDNIGAYCKTLYFCGPKSLWIWHIQNLHPLNSMFTGFYENLMHVLVLKFSRL
jgi:hypothetical protein